MLLDLDRARRHFAEDVRFGEAKAALAKLKKYDDEKYFRLFAIEALKRKNGMYTPISAYHNRLYHEILSMPDATEEDKREAQRIQNYLLAIEHNIAKACNNSRDKINGGKKVWVLMTGRHIKPEELKTDVYAGLRQLGLL